MMVEKKIQVFLCGTIEGSYTQVDDLKFKSHPPLIKLGGDYFAFEFSRIRGGVKQFWYKSIEVCDLEKVLADISTDICYPCDNHQWNETGECLNCKKRYGCPHGVPYRYPCDKCDGP